MHCYLCVLCCRVCARDTSFCFFFFNDPAPTEISPLPLHDALPILEAGAPLPLHAEPGALRDYVAEAARRIFQASLAGILVRERSEEHTSELQSQSNLVCRLLLEKKKQIYKRSIAIGTPH